MRFAVIYASTHGHTARIAARLAETIAAEDADVEVAAAGEEAMGVVQRSDAVVVAGSVHRGSRQHELSEFVTRHRRVLQDMPSAFGSVSLTAVEDDEELRAETRRVIDEFVEDTGWTPDAQTAVAGAFQFSKYAPFERLIYATDRTAARHRDRSVRRHGADDWDAVDAFARDLVVRTRRRIQERSAGGTTSTGHGAEPRALT